MDQRKENKMGTTPIFPLIVSMSLPAIFSMLVQSLYNIVDSIFVAKISSQALSAVSLAFPIQTLMISIAVGTGVGINSVVSRRLGEGHFADADNTATHGFLLGFFNWMIIALFGILGTKPFFHLFSDNPEIVKLGMEYTYIVTIASVGVFVEICMEKTLQATGNMIYPMVFQLVGCITNLVLDPIMIFGLFGFPKMGIAGAALATVIGQMLAMTVSLVVVFTQNHAVTISLKKFHWNWRIVKDIYAVGFPSIIMQSISSVLVMGLNGILITFSEAAVNVLGVYYKLQSFVFMPAFGLNQGVMPILGYNFGAGNKKRFVRTVKTGGALALIIILVGTLIFQIFPTQLLMLFNDDAEMIRIGIPALRITSLCFIPAAMDVLFATLFQATGKGFYSLMVSLLRQLIVILPVAYVLSFLGLQFVWWSYPIAEIVALVFSSWLTLQLYRNRISQLQPLHPEQDF